MHLDILSAGAAKAALSRLDVFADAVRQATPREVGGADPGGSEERRADEDHQGGDHVHHPDRGAGGGDRQDCCGCGCDGRQAERKAAARAKGMSPAVGGRRGSLNRDAVVALGFTAPGTGWIFAADG